MINDNFITLDFPSHKRLEFTQAMSLNASLEYLTAIKNGLSPRDAFVEMLSHSLKNPDETGDKNEITNISDKELAKLGYRYLENSEVQKIFDSISDEQDFFRCFQMAFELYYQGVFLRITDRLQPIVNSFKEIGELFSTLQETIKPVAKTVSEFLENARPILEKLDQIFKEFKDENKGFSNLCVKFGWIPHDGLPVAGVLQIFGTFKQGQSGIQDDIDGLYLEKFNDKVLSDMLQEWKQRSWLAKRNSILDEIIHSHVTRNYFVAIPAMLSQIEGIVIDGFGITTWAKQDKIKNKIEQLLDSKDPLALNQAVKAFYATYLAVNFMRGSPPQSFLSRDAILHGGDTGYGTITNSLKCILLFDYLQSQFRFVSLKSDNCYHSPDCSLLTATGREREVYQDEAEAKSDGKSPCAICLKANHTI